MTPRLLVPRAQHNVCVDAVPPSAPSRADLRPIRLVVTDDCERSRLTVFFRGILAVPHLVWILLWGVAAFAVAFVVWLAVLFEGRAPRTLHGFIASYVRYGVHLGAYLALAANPYPGFTGQPGYPVDVEIDPPQTQGRWGAGFRLVLAVPALLLATVLGGGFQGGGSTSVDPGLWTDGTSFGSLGTSIGGVVAIVALLGWFSCLARGRMPRGMRDLAAYAIGYGAQTYGYALLLTSRYPSSDPSLVHPAELPEHPVRITVTDPLRRSRLTVFFRLLLALPLFVWAMLWTVAVALAAFLAWLAALATGRVPRPLQRFLAAFVRFLAHLDAFVYLVGGPFPGFTGAAGSYPIDVTIEPAGQQRRLVTCFRLFLAVPAFLLASGYGGVLLVVAVLGWFAALFTGRMPSGLRDIGAAGVRYNAQTRAYMLLGTDRYPNATPFLRGKARSEELALNLELGVDPVGEAT